MTNYASSKGTHWTGSIEFGIIFYEHYAMKASCLQLSIFQLWNSCLIVHHVLPTKPRQFLLNKWWSKILVCLLDHILKVYTFPTVYLQQGNVNDLFLNTHCTEVPCWIPGSHPGLAVCLATSAPQQWPCRSYGPHRSPHPARPWRWPSPYVPLVVRRPGCCCYAGWSGCLVVAWFVGSAHRGNAQPGMGKSSQFESESWSCCRQRLNTCTGICS